MENLPPRGQQGLGQRVTETGSGENPLQSNVGCCRGCRVSGAQAGQSQADASGRQYVDNGVTHRWGTEDDTSVSGKPRWLYCQRVDEGRNKVSGGESGGSKVPREATEEDLSQPHALRRPQGPVCFLPLLPSGDFQCALV